MNKWMASFLYAGVMMSASAAVDPVEVLKKADTARGGGFAGLHWKIALQAIDGQKTEQQGLTVKTDGSSSLAEFYAPQNLSDQKLLMVGRNMWFSRTGLRRPVPISPRQRLLGQAANGDIAATNYAADYDPKLAGEETIGGEPCYKLVLTAKTDSVSYSRIDYWVSTTKGQAVRADFYSVSGKMLKSAQFEYGGQVEYQGKTLPFISKMVIEDRVRTEQKTVLQYSDIKAGALPRRTFDVNFLTN